MKNLTTSRILLLGAAAGAALFISCGSGEALDMSDFSKTENIDTYNAVTTWNETKLNNPDSLNAWLTACQAQGGCGTNTNPSSSAVAVDPSSSSVIDPLSSSSGIVTPSSSSIVTGSSSSVVVNPSSSSVSPSSSSVALPSSSSTTPSSSSTGSSSSVVTPSSSSGGVVGTTITVSGTTQYPLEAGTTYTLKYSCDADQYYQKPVLVQINTGLWEAVNVTLGTKTGASQQNVFSYSDIWGSWSGSASTTGVSLTVDKKALVSCQ